MTEQREQPSLWQLSHDIAGVAESVKATNESVKALTEAIAQTYVRKDVYDAQRALAEEQREHDQGRIRALEESKLWQFRNLILVPLCTFAAMVAVAFFVSLVIK